MLLLAMATLSAAKLRKFSCASGYHQVVEWGLQYIVLQSGFYTPITSS